MLLVVFLRVGIDAAGQAWPPAFAGGFGWVRGRNWVVGLLM